jgi:hypothetical protein
MKPAAPVTSTVIPYPSETPFARPEASLAHILFEIKGIRRKSESNRH